MRISELTTPALLIDAARLEHNLRAMAEAPPPRDDEVIGWQPLVLARPQRCARCGILMGRGDSAYASVTPKGVGTSWRCEECPID